MELSERLQQCIDRIREDYGEDSDLIDFLKTIRSVEAQDMAEVILDGIEEGDDYSIYYGDDATSTDTYYIVKTAFEDTGFNNEYIKRMSKQIGQGLKNAGPILKYPKKLFSKEKIEDGTFQKEVEKQAKQSNCRPEEVMINITGSDDSYDDLRMCHLWTIDMIGLLKEINTKTAKQYIRAIQNDPVLKKALNICIFDY